MTIIWKDCGRCLPRQLMVSRYLLNRRSGMMWISVGSKPSSSRSNTRCSNTQSGGCGFFRPQDASYRSKLHRKKNLINIPCGKYSFLTSFFDDTSFYNFLTSSYRAAILSTTDSVLNFFSKSISMPERKKCDTFWVPKGKDRMICPYYFLVVLVQMNEPFFVSILCSAE